MTQTEYHSLNKTYNETDGFQKIKRLLNFENGPKLNILDVGCGSGMLGQKLMSFGHSVVGLDVYPNPNNSWIKACDITGIWPVIDKSFDVVICTDVAEHLENPEFILTQAQRVLKTDGKLIFGVPNHFDIRQRFRILFGRGIVHWDNIKHNQHAWNYAHVRFFSLTELKTFFMHTGWQIIKGQYNFMGAGIVPNQMPKFVKNWILKIWPNLFSGKFIFLLGQKSSGKLNSLNNVYIPSTPLGY